MVFSCRCISFSSEEKEEIQDERITQAKSTSTETFYTACSNLNRSLPDSHTNTSDFSILVQKTSNLRVFTVVELRAATKNFCMSWKIREGGFGSVYWGTIKSLEHPFDEIQVAVKKADGRLQGYKEWLREVSLLGVVEHPNLVKLVGYCVEDDERLLVYEYMPNRSMKDHLSTRSETPLSWTIRLKVARDVARAFAYLHEEMDFPIIFGDFESSNILLDEQWTVKLSDFGMALLRPRRPTSVSTGVKMGYAAPEYIATGNLTVKCDVWSYGVFLYKLFTGNRPENEHQLLEWLKPYIGSKRFQLIVDPRLEGNYSLKSAQKLSIIANKCLSRNPKSRPKMSEVLEMVNQLPGVPSQATNPAPPPKSLVLPSPKSLVRVVSINLMKVFMGNPNGKKTRKDKK